MIKQRGVVITQPTQAPLSLSMTLQQKYVVAIIVGPNAAARDGEADHHIVKAPGWNKGDALFEFGNIRMTSICTLNQKCPDIVTDKITGLERAMLNAPRSIALVDQSALDKWFRRECLERLFAERRTEARERILDQQWLFLPVLPDKLIARYRELYVTDRGSDRIVLICSVPAIQRGAQSGVRSANSVARPM